MPLSPEHILRFLERESEPKFKSEILGYLTQRIHELCFEECQIDRIACTLQPKCSRRFLLKLRIKNNLTVEDLPKFCYTVLKGVVEREFRNKTVVYKPFDSYLFLVDFLDIFFHGDYRRLNRFISFNKWKETFEILEDRINNRDEHFNYLFTGQKNYLIFKFGDRIHIIYVKEKYSLCNASREYIPNVELLSGLIQLYSSLYFPEVKLNVVPSRYIEITIKIPYEVLLNLKDDRPDKIDSKAGKYFWNVFWEDLDWLTQYCEELHLKIDSKQNLKIILLLRNQSKRYLSKGKSMSLRFRDLKLVMNFITRIYNDYYVVWLE